MGASNANPQHNFSEKGLIVSYNQNNGSLDNTLNESQLLDSFNTNMLKYHNDYRLMHQSEILNNNEELNQKANKYAKDLLTSPSYVNNKEYIIYKGDILGENILISNKEEKEATICDNWYKEILNYKFGLNSFQKGTNHFTQLIWENTKDVGFGFYFDSKNNKYCYVALYFPAGNIFGQFTDNVHFPLRKNPK